MAHKVRTQFARLIAWLLFPGPIRVAGGRLVFYPATGALLPVVAGGSPEGDGDGDGEGTGAGAGDGDGDGDGGSGDDDGDRDGEGSGDAGGDGEGSGDDDGKKKDETNWKSMSRKHERAAKKARDDLAEAQRKLKEREDADKSEQEKAIEKARQEARTEAESGFQETRRADKIESAVTKLAVAGFKVKDGDEEKTLKFRNPDDAQLRIDRALRNGDLEYDDIYADGKVKTDAVTEFLREQLEENDYLQAEAQKSRKVEGGADGGKGKGGGGGEPSVEDLVKEMAAK